VEFGMAETAGPTIWKKDICPSGQGSLLPYSP
jgi:hypothetical protein